MSRSVKMPTKQSRSITRTAPRLLFAISLAASLTAVSGGAVKSPFRSMTLLTN
jgi:hypothetical protein